MLSNPKIFEDNYGYYNYAKLLELLNTIKVIYYPDTNDVAGTYNLLTNVMKLYDGTCLEEISKSTFTHEFSHMIQNTNPNYGNSFWDEGINAIANNEYYCSDRENDGSNYSFQSSVIRALDLIIGGDVFRKYYTNNDLNAIKSELYRIYPDEEKANEFMALANYYQCLFFTQIYNLPFTDYDMTQEEVANLIFQDLTFYYETKYGRSVESDLVMLFFVNNNLFKEKIGNMYDFPDSDIYYTILFDKPSIVNPDEKNKAYSFKVVKQNIVSYNEESYEECVSGGLINEAGEPVIKGLIIDKENNKVLRPQYDRKEMLIEINDENRFINDDLNR